MYKPMTTYAIGRIQDGVFNPEFLTTASSEYDHETTVEYCRFRQELSGDQWCAKPTQTWRYSEVDRVSADELGTLMDLMSNEPWEFA